MKRTLLLLLLLLGTVFLAFLAINRLDHTPRTPLTTPLPGAVVFPSVPSASFANSTTAASAQTTPDPTALPPITPPSSPGSLTLASPHVDIRQRITNPRWNTLWIEGRAVIPSPDGDLRMQQVQHIQAWLARDGRGRLLQTPFRQEDPLSSYLDLSLESAWISQPPSLQRYDFSTADLTTEFIPFTLHPLEKTSALLSALFPAELSIISSDVQPLQMDSQAGRNALVVQWAGYHLWIDAETGVILRRLPLPSTSRPDLQLFIDAIVFNPSFPDSLLSTDNLAGLSFEPAPATADSTDMY